VLPAHIPSEQRPGPFADVALGNYVARMRLLSTIDSFAETLSSNINREGLASTEISYTRFGPGAFLQRHNDVKGRHSPTRRSVSCLIYLNKKLKQRSPSRRPTRWYLALRDRGTRLLRGCMSSMRKRGEGWISYAHDDMYCMHVYALLNQPVIES